jgi:Fur family transcriptional regulator, ferric uptake regulator
MEKMHITEKFVSFLKANGQRVTKERLIILDTIIASSGHIEADDLFIKLKGKGLKSSRATVYNTLQLLVKSKIIAKSNLGESHQHYERAYGLPQHHHLICSICGSVVEFEEKNIELIQTNICKKYKFKSNNYLFQITGTCNKCLKTS